MTNTPAGIFRAKGGIAIGNMRILAGFGIPGGDNGVQDSAQIGSNYYDMSDGSQYAKTQTGAGTDKWVRQTTQIDLETFMADAKLLDGLGNAYRAAVSQHNALLVAGIPPALSPPGTASKYRYFQGRPGLNGLNAGTLAQNVNGSTTPQKFYIGSQADHDLYITGIVFVLSGSSLTHAQFGSLSALANGYSVYAIEAGTTTYLVQNAKSNGDLWLQAGAARPFGSGLNTNLFDNWTGTTDACVVWFPLGELIPGGLRIGMGTQDQLVCEVRDNLTAMPDLTVRVFGYRHYD